MHICFLSGEYPHPDYPHGGVGTFIQTIGRALVAKGIQVTVVGIGYTRRHEEEEDQGVQVIRLRRSNWPKFSAFDHFHQINQQIKEINSRNPIDIVEGTELSYAFLRKLPNVKYLIRMHGGHHFFAASENRDINWWKGYQEKRSFEKADAVLGVSQYVVEHTSRYLSFEAKKKGVIFNPANLSRFYPADLTKQVKGRIFFAGTVCEKKGVRQLIQAMPMIKEAIPEAHLFIAGRDSKISGSDKSYINYLKEYIHVSVEKDIHFLGSVPNQEIPLKIEEAEVCCYPSHMETFGIVAIEAMAMAKPVVFTKLGPGSEIISHGANGLLCNPLSPEDIAEKVIYMQKHPEDAWQMGLKARQFALDNFALDKIVEQNIQLYQSLL